MNINLTPYFEEFIQKCVTSGRYEDGSKVMQTALELLKEYEEHQVKLKDLRAAIEEGENSLDVPYDINKVIARGKERRALKLARGNHA